MQLRAVCLLLSLIAGGFSAQAQEGTYGLTPGEITIRDEESPVAASHGAVPNGLPLESFSWQGSQPDTLKSLLSQLDTPLAWQAQRQVAVLTLSSPVLPDAEDSVPENWLLLRLQTLQRIGEYDAAWALFEALSPSLLTEPLARIGSDLAWSTRRVTQACRLTSGLVEEEGTNFESENSKLYWLVHYVVCQRLRGKQAEADVSLSLLTETVPDALPPLLVPLMQDWGTDRPLPPLSDRDALLLPALSALLSTPLENDMKPLGERIGPGFVTTGQAASLPPPLQGALAQTRALPILLRSFMAENAVRYHLLPGEELGRFYDAAQAEKAASPGLADTYQRALLYGDALRARTPRNQALAIGEALRAYHRHFSARDARAILGRTLRTLSAGEAPVPVPLAFETMALYLDRGEREEASRLARSLNGRQDDAAELAAHVAGRVLRLTGDGREGGEAVIMPQFSQGQAAEIIWLATRYGKLMEALGYQVRWPAVNLEFAAPPPDIDYASPDHLNALRLAHEHGSPAERLLRSVLVLEDTPPQRTSDQALLQVVASWRELGLTSLTSALVAEALLGIPDPREP